MSVSCPESGPRQPTRAGADSGFGAWRLLPAASLRRRTGRGFAIRTSDLFRVSSFGLRICCLLLAPLPPGQQVCCSGAMMKNGQIGGPPSQLGYGSTWYSGNRTARSWSTTGGKPRMDLVNFTYHHALAPLLSDETLEMELS